MMFMLQLTMMSHCVLHFPQETFLHPEWPQFYSKTCTAFNNQTGNNEFKVAAKIQLMQKTGYVRPGSQLYTSEDWPSYPLQALILKKKIGKYIKMKPLHPPTIISKNIYEVPQLFQSEDLYDKRILRYNLCPQHQEAVKKCAKCKGETKQSTIEEELEYNMIKDSVEKVVIDGSPML